jgi:hypothetical protein
VNVLLLINIRDKNNLLTFENPIFEELKAGLPDWTALELDNYSDAPLKDLALQLLKDSEKALVVILADTENIKRPPMVNQWLTQFDHKIMLATPLQSLIPGYETLLGKENVIHFDRAKTVIQKLHLN